MRGFKCASGNTFFHLSIDQIDIRVNCLKLIEDMKKGINDGTYKSPHLKLLKLSRETRTAFEMSGFDMYIETFNDLETAIASF